MDVDVEGSDGLGRFDKVRAGEKSVYALSVLADVLWWGVGVVGWGGVPREGLGLTRLSL